MRSPHLLIMTIAALVFAAITAHVGAVNAMTNLDRALSSAVQEMRNPVLDAIAIAITLSGDTIVLVWVAAALVISLFVVRLRRLSGVVLIASLVTTFSVVALKGWIERPRPTADLYPGVEAFSFPSGHTTNSAVLYGILLLLAASPVFGRRRPRLAAALGALIILIGVSRIYLAAHWPSDVIAGWCFAAIMLSAVSLAIARTRPVERRERTVLWISLAAAVFGLAYGALNFALALEKYSPRKAIEMTLNAPPQTELIMQTRG